MSELDGVSKASPEGLTLTWRRYLSEQDAHPRRWAVPVSCVVMLAGAALTIALSVPSIAIFFLAWASLPIPYYMPRRLRLHVGRDAVELRRQRLFGNTWLWMTMVSFIGFVGTLSQIIIGDPQVWRLLIPCVGSAGVGIYCARTAFRLRGPLTISNESVADQVGYRIALRNSQIEAVPPERGGPFVRILPVEKEFPSASGYLIPPREFGLDFNTAASAVQQLVDWGGTDRITTSAEVAALITARPPAGLAVGESVDLVVSIPAGNVS